MKKLFTLSLTAILFTSCFQYAKYTASMSGPIPSEIPIYEDDTLSATFVLQRESILTVISNKTAQPIKIDWINSSIKLPHIGATHLVPYNTRRMDVGRPNPTTIFANSSFTGPIFPASNVGIQHNQYLLPNSVVDSEAKRMAAEMKGKPIHILLPVTFGSVTKDYVFTLVID